MLQTENGIRKCFRLPIWAGEMILLIMFNDEIKVLG